MQLRDYTVEELARLIPTKSVLYRIMIKNFDYFLPHETSKAITEDYLLGVLRGKYYSLKLKERKELQLKGDFNAGNLELITEISNLTKKNLGFSINSSPDREWLLDVLNTLDSNNKLLKGDPTLLFKRQLPDK